MNSHAILEIIALALIAFLEDKLLILQKSAARAIISRIALKFMRLLLILIIIILTIIIIIIIIIIFQVLLLFFGPCSLAVCNYL